MRRTNRMSNVKVCSVLYYPIKYVYGKVGESHGAYVVGVPVTVLEDSKAKLKKLLTEAMRRYVMWCIETGDPIPSPSKGKTTHDTITIEVR